MKKLFSSKSLVVGVALIIIVLLLGFVGPLVYTVDPYTMDPMNRLQAPSLEHPMGTDDFGRDLLARVMAGAKVSLGVGASVTAIASLLGLAIGVYCTRSKAADQVLMRICDALMAIPGVLLAIALMAVMGASVTNVIIALTIVSTPGVARVVRSRAIVVKDAAFIEALKVQGASRARIMLLHIVPNVLSPFFVQAAFVFADAVLSEAALSFLGLGISAPDPSWGNILQAGKAVISKAWWMIVFPAIMVVASVMGLNLVGDGTRDVLDPNTQQGR